MGILKTHQFQANCPQDSLVSMKYCMGKHPHHLTV
jgi:hypothetical protein